VVESGSKPNILLENPIMTQIRFRSEEVTKEHKALGIIHATTVHNDVFIKTLDLETTKEV